jgi:hypothetical protein
MARGNGLHLINSLRRDEPSSLGEGLEAVLQSKGHAFEQTSVDHIGERMPVQDSMKIGRESQSARDLPETSKENFGARHLRAGRQVLRVARITNNGVRCDAAQ